MKSKISTRPNFFVSSLLILFTLLASNGYSQCPSGIEAYLRFESSADASYSDEISNHDGIIASGGPQSISGLANVGSSLSFNGTSDELNLLNSSDFNWSSGSSFSIELWVKYTEASVTRVFIGRDAISSSAQWWIGTTDAGKAAWYISDSNGDNAYLESPGAINNGQWHHIVAVKDGSSLKLYIDGVAVSQTGSFSGTFNMGTSSISIGNITIPPDDYFYEGAIDEVAIYNVALTSVQITEHLQNNGGYGIGYCDDESPKILTLPNQIATIGQQYVYSVSASGNTIPEYRLLSKPSGMNINDGVITWTPADAGSNTKVIVEAFNDKGSDIQEYSIYLAEVPEIPSDLSAIWRFDNNAFKFDYSGTHELVGGAGVTNGLIGSAANFNGTSGTSMDLDDTYEPADIFFDFKDGVNNNYSISFWMKSSATGVGNLVAVGRRVNVAENNLAWWIGFDSGTGEAVWSANDYRVPPQDDETVQISGGLVNDGNWHLITAVQDQDQDMDILYVDGVEVASYSYQHADFGGNTALNVGWFNFDASNHYYFIGIIDELSFFKSALSLSRIQTIYNEGIEGTGIIKENYFPQITSTIDTIANEDVFYRDTIYFNDINDGDVVTPSIVGKPDWLTYSFTSLDTFVILYGTPTNDLVGEYPMTLMLDDGSATTSQAFTLHVLNVNDEPIISTMTMPSLSVDEDQLYEYTFKATDIDADDVLTISATQKPDWLTFTQQTDTTALLSGTPLNDDADSTYTIILNVNDGTVDVSLQFNLVVTGINDKPIITAHSAVSFNEDEEFTITLDLLSVTDVDNDPQDLAIEIFDGDNYTFENTVIKPTKDYFGSLTVNMVVSDNDSVSDDFEFNMTVIEVNDAPVVISTIDSIAQENVEYINVFEFFDVEEEEITVEFYENESASWLTYSNDTLFGTPSSEDIGQENKVKIRIQDASLAEVFIEYTIEVRNTNDEPEFTSSPDTIVDDYELYEYQVTVTDKDGDPVTVQAKVKPDWLTFANNTLSGTPDWEDATKTFNVTLEASDGIATTEQIFQINVTNKNSIPEITSAAKTVDTVLVGTTYAYFLTAIDIDEDDSLMFAADILPTWMSFTATASGGNLTGNPTEENVGNHNVVLIVSDDRGDQVNMQFTIYVKTVVGIQHNIVNTLSLYPNPARSEVTLDLASLKNPDKIEILDVTGKIKLTEYLLSHKNELKLNVSGLTKGLYFVRVQDDDMIYLSKLIIK